MTSDIGRLARSPLGELGSLLHRWSPSPGFPLAADCHERFCGIPQCQSQSESTRGIKEVQMVRGLYQQGLGAARGMTPARSLSSQSMCNNKAASDSLGH